MFLQVCKLCNWKHLVSTNRLQIVTFRWKEGQLGANCDKIGNIWFSTTLSLKKTKNLKHREQLQRAKSDLVALQALHKILNLHCTALRCTGGCGGYAGVTA